MKTDLEKRIAILEDAINARARMLGKIRHRSGKERITDEILRLEGEVRKLEEEASSVLSSPGSLFRTECDHP